MFTFFCFLHVLHTLSLYPEKLSQNFFPSACKFNLNFQMTVRPVLFRQSKIIVDEKKLIEKLLSR